MMKYPASIIEAGANEACDQDEESEQNDSFCLIWHQLCYFQEKLVNTNPLLPWKKDKMMNQILKPMNGQLKSGTVNAILGPSGSGKTTLLNCITGRTKEKGRGGNCFIRSSVKLKCNLANFPFAYVPQVDYFFTRFTLRETVTFACRLNNSLWTREKQEKEVNSIIDSLDLKDEIHLPLNRLSGGQLKRTSIALELICRPLILVLDEPTSGLDVDNALKLISILKKLTRVPSPSAIRPIILLTIHSPNFQLFQLMDQIYLLSKDGHNIFQGPPDLAVSYFSFFGFKKFEGNPAEYLIDVASGKYGVENFDLMAHRASKYVSDLHPQMGDRSIYLLKNRPSGSFFTETWLLMGRWIVYYFIKVPQAIARAFDHLLILFLLTYVLIEPIAEDAFCWRTLGPGAHNCSSLPSIKKLSELKFKSELVDKVNKFITLASYCGFILIDVTFVPSIITVLLMTLHMSTYKRELANSWYTRGSFFTSKIITDAIVRIFCLIPGSILFFYRSGAPVQFWPLFTFTCVLIVSSTIWENLSTSITLFIGCRKSKLLDTVATVFLLQLLDFIFIDFLIPQQNVSNFAATFKILSPQANLYKMVIVSLFGFARCSQEEEGLIKFMDITFSPPKDLFKRIWRSCNITQNDFARLSDLLYVQENQLGALYISLDEWVSVQDEYPHHSQSRMLDFFTIKEHYYLQIGILLLWLLASFLILWWTLVTRKIHQL